LRPLQRPTASQGKRQLRFNIARAGWRELFVIGHRRTIAGLGERSKNESYDAASAEALGGALSGSNDQRSGPTLIVLGIVIAARGYFRRAWTLQ
jgi:hypothetical protein